MGYVLTLKILGELVNFHLRDGFRLLRVYHYFESRQVIDLISCLMILEHLVLAFFILLLNFIVMEVPLRPSQLS